MKAKTSGGIKAAHNIAYTQNVMGKLKRQNGSTWHTNCSSERHRLYYCNVETRKPPQKQRVF